VGYFRLVGRPEAQVGPLRLAGDRGEFGCQWMPATVKIRSMGHLPERMSHLESSMLTIRRVGCWKLVCLVLIMAPARPVAATEAEQEAPTICIGEPVALVVQPETIRLSGPRAMQQVIVTGRYADGSQRDLTPYCTWSAEIPDVVTVAGGGFVQPRKDGSTHLVAQAGSYAARVPVVVENFGTPLPISFRHDLIAALSVAGCNQGACHGIPSGRGGFKLSLRGYDPAVDYVELTHGAQGRRTDRLDAQASLIYQKGLGRVPHQGGKRFDADSVAARTMLAWLEQGMPDDSTELPVLNDLEIVPGSRVLRAPARRQQLAVLAHYSDGGVRDVTRLTVFGSSDESLAHVGGDGLVELHRAGEAAILCRYLDVIRCVRLTCLEPRDDFRWPDPPINNYVDRHVFEKLKTLNILPSELCNDQEFLRRVFLDLCGILPTPQEVQAFLADGSVDKRAVMIDRLLQRPEFADLMAHHWLDVLRCNRLHLQVKGSHVYHRWLRSHIEDNTPWNQVVRELLTASGSTFANPAANFFRGAYDSGAPPSVRDPQEMAETTAQLFFGIRMQCAKCHNHPFERWTQDDYYRLTAWFSQVRGKADTHHPGRAPTGRSWQLREDAVVVYPDRAREFTHPRTGQRIAPKIMGMPAPAIAPGDDRRDVLAEQITSAGNPFFASATVNRLWFMLLGKGIVDPPDDFRDSNPPANDALLKALAEDFVDHRFDMKHLIRTIANSRTYQLSSHGNETNRDDNKYFSHALVERKRLPAEVLLDAICAATGVPEVFQNYPAGTRAVQLPDTQVVYTGGAYASWERHPFLKAFGQPAREVACQCEREGDVSLARMLELKNGQLIHDKIRAPGNRLGKLLAQPAAGDPLRQLPAPQILDELFLATLSRPPLAREAAAALDLVEKAADKRAAWESVLWALLNADEFFMRY